MKKILVIRLSSIGDIVLTTPIIRCIKQQVPDCQLHLLTKAKFADVVGNNPYIDKLHLLNDSLKNTISALRKEKFDYIVDLHKNIRSLIIRTALCVPSASFNKLNFKKFLLTRLKINRMPDKHIVDRYFEAAKQLNVTNDGKGLDFFFSEEEMQSKLPIPEAFRSNYIAIAIGAQHYTKIYPAEKVGDLCRALYPNKIVLIGGKTDIEHGKQIVATSQGNVINTCGQLSLRHSALALKNADLVVANDTGMMHIAAALNKPIVSIWGGTVPEFGMYPYMPKGLEHLSHIVENKQLKCRPCHKLGRKSCPKGHFKCMNDININSIVETIKKAMEQ